MIAAADGATLADETVICRVLDVMIIVAAESNQLLAITTPDMVQL